MSATHSALGRSAAKQRLTRSGALLCPCTRRVMTTKPRNRLTPCSLARRIRRATRFLLTFTPWSINYARTRARP
jgi:hypothetical protein